MLGESIAGESRVSRRDYDAKCRGEVDLYGRPSVQIWRSE